MKAPTLGERRDRLAELEAERDRVTARLASSGQREADARYMILRSQVQTRPGSQVQGPVQAILKEREKDRAALHGLEEDIKALLRLIAAEEQEAREEAAKLAADQLADVRAVEQEKAAALCDAYVALHDAYEAYVEQARTLEGERLDVLGKLAEAGLVSDRDEWLAAAPGWAFPSVPRTFRAALDTLYEGSTRNSFTGLAIGNQIGELLPEIPDPEQEFRGDTPAHGGHGRPQREYLGA